MPPLEWWLYNGSRTTIALSGLSGIAGVVLIRLGVKEWHKRVMAVACVLALIFVGLYLARSALFPPPKYHGDWRSLYLWILGSHTIMSVVNLPLVIVTLFLALTGRFKGHKRVAPYTAAVWIFVAASGWTIFLFNS